MRPANQHRQIRSTALSSEAAGKNVLLHFSSVGESRVSQSAPSQSKPSAQSAAQLQSRVQELEKENFQLRHHVQQAEQSLRNYRELLGNHSPQTQTQTQPQTKTSSDNGAAASLAALEVAHRELQQRLQEVSKQKDRFARKLDEYAQQARERDGLRREAEEARAAARQKDEEIAALRAQLATAQKALTSPKKSSSSSSSRTVCVPIHTLHSLQHSVRELRKELVSLRMSSKQSLSSFALSLAGDLSETVRERVAKLADLTHALQSDLSTKTHELIVLRVESEREKRELLDRLERLSSTTSNQESSSFVSPQKQAQQAVAMVSSAVGTSPEKASFVTPVISRKAPSPSLRRDVFCSPMLDWKLHELHQDTVNKNLSIKEQEIADLRAERETMLRTAQALREQLQAAHTAWQNLCTLHAAEIKAIRHVAHVKELMRVAKEREQTLEKERAHMEIKYLKEIQGALNFSLNTAEQSLSETHPHVVVKLVEGRTKRVKFFEQAFAKKLKDIEQRSLDTCVVNTGHLEQFQKKAIENEKNAEAMTQAANEELAKRFRTGQQI